MELFEGGVLAADVTDSSCSNSDFTTSGIVSRFESANESRATFGAGDLGWKGYIDFKESSIVGYDDFKESSIIGYDDFNESSSGAPQQTIKPDASAAQ